MYCKGSSPVMLYMMFIILRPSSDVFSQNMPQIPAGVLPKDPSWTTQKTPLSGHGSPKAWGCQNSSGHHLRLIWVWAPPFSASLSFSSPIFPAPTVPRFPHLRDHPPSAGPEQNGIGKQCLPLVLPWPPPSLEPPSKAMSQTCWWETVESLSLTRGTCMITGHVWMYTRVWQGTNLWEAELPTRKSPPWPYIPLESLGNGKITPAQSFLLTVFNLSGMGCRLGQRDCYRPRQSKKHPGWRPAALDQEVAPISGFYHNTIPLLGLPFLCICYTGSLEPQGRRLNDGPT